MAWALQLSIHHIRYHHDTLTILCFFGVCWSGRPQLKVQPKVPLVVFAMFKVEPWLEVSWLVHATGRFAREVKTHQKRFLKIQKIYIHFVMFNKWKLTRLAIWKQTCIFSNAIHFCYIFLVESHALRLFRIMLDWFLEERRCSERRSFGAVN